MSEKEKEAIEQLRSWRKYIIEHRESVNKANDIEFYLRTALNLIEKQQKELDNLKEIEQLHQEENGKLRVELEQQKEKNIELEAKRIWNKGRIEELKNELVQEREKNKELEEHQKQYLDGELITAKQGKFFEKMIKENYIRKDKLKEKIEELEKEQKEYKNSQEWEIQNEIIAQINILKDLLEEN